MLTTTISAHEARRSWDGATLTRRMRVDTRQWVADLQLSLSELADPETGHCLLRITGTTHTSGSEDVTHLETETHSLPVDLCLAGDLLVADGLTELSTTVLEADDTLSLAVHLGTCGLLSRKEWF